MQIDYLIIGQGIAGTLLSHQLISKGKKVIVIDQPNPNSASKVASGIINPVTGRRVVSTWMIDELLPFAYDAYSKLEEELDVSIISQKDILAFHSTEQMQQAFYDKMDENDAYIERASNEDSYKKEFHFQHGVSVISPVYLIDVQLLIERWRAQLFALDCLIESKFDWADCKVEEDNIQYKNIIAKKVILCNGFGVYDDPYFKRLPYGITKGEALIVDIPNLQSTNIYKQGYSIVPWKEGLFWVGSSFDRAYNDELPSTDFRNKVIQQLDSWLKIPYTIIDHLSSIRTGTIDRRPLIGTHPLHPAVAIFNGMGTKGCSLAPYFAQEFSDYLTDGGVINELADIQRFAKVLAR